MDLQLRNFIANETPPINRDIADGLACKHIPHVEEYIDNVIRGVAKGFPEGLEYVNCARCTPLEEFEETTRKKTKRIFDIARSDFYMMKYFFRYKGEDLPPRFLYLPFVSSAGTITISGSKFVISPVLTDKVISVGTSNVFVRLIRDKLIFERLGYNIIVDNARETVQVVWSTVYHKNNELKSTVSAECTLMHYLLGKYGFSRTFKMFGSCEPIIGTGEINTTNYPPGQWVICRSTKVKPKGFGKSFYQATDIAVAIKLEEFTPMVKSMVGGFFYIVDHFPARILPEYVNSTRLWIVLLGHILFSGNISEGVLFDDVSEHFRSIDEYIDDIMVKQLREINYDCSDIYQLFAIVIANFDLWLISSSETVSSMYDKELSILYHITDKILRAIHILHYRLRSAAKKQLTTREIIKTMNSVFKTGLIFSISRQNACISTVNYSGDNKFFKITSLLNEPIGKKKRGSINDPAKRLHASIAEVGNAWNLPKSEPTGRHRINPYVKVDDRSIVIRDSKKLNLMTQAQELIKRN